MTQQRAWTLRGSIVLGLVAVGALQAGTVFWLFRIIPEHLFQEHETQVADAKLAFWFRCIAIASPLFLAVWLLLAQVLWRRVAPDGPAMTEQGGWRKWAGRTASVLYWAMVVVFVLNGIGGSVIQDWQHRRWKEQIYARFGEEFDARSMKYREVDAPKPVAGQVIALGDLVLTIPGTVKAMPDDSLQGCGLRITGGHRSGGASADFPPDWDDEMYPARLFYRIGSHERWLEAFYSFKKSDLESVRSRLGLSAGTQIIVYRLHDVWPHHDVISFSASSGLRVFVDELTGYDVNDEKKRAWRIWATGRRDGKHEAYLVVIREAEPSKGAADRRDVVMSIAASLRRK